MPLTRLNQEQYKAATTSAGKNLVIASAGTGKTSTIVARIAHLLNLGINPSKILLLTFTNKASAEMIERLQKHFNPKTTSKITAGTFHSVSYKLLRELDKNVVLKQPSELKVLLKSLIERRKFHHISDVKPYGGAYLYDVYSLFQNKSVDGDFNNWFCENYDEQSVYVEIYEDVLREFEDEKTKFGYVDFNDLLIRMKKELKKGAPIYFDEILVDEYQDTNSLQGSLIDSFNTKSLFCVGDFDQSIYAFNGANIEIIGSFKDRYKDAKIYTLNTNYRSTKLILDLANKVIKNNPRLYEKELIVGRVEKPKPPRLLVFDELFSQYANIAKIIKESKYKHDDIAVIFRNNSSADGIEASLRELGISAKRKGGVSFFESREIKALTNIVGVFVNPKDMMAFMQIFEYAKGIGAATSKEIYDALMALGHSNLLKGLLKPDLSVEVFKPKVKNYQLGLFDELDNIDSSSRFKHLGFDDEFLKHPALKYQKLSEDGAILLYEFYNLFKKLLALKTSNAIIKECINSRVFGLISSHIATKKATSKNGKIDEELKKEFITKIYQKCEILIDMSKKYRDIYSFYNFLTLGSGELSEGEGVNLLSIHASKGLEFGLVFVVDLAQKRFPNYKLMSMGGSLEEERRLFYVAVTRAKDELILSYAKYDKIRKISYDPSEFLIEAGMVK